MSTTNKWLSTDKALPTWEDGEVLLMLQDSKIVRARFDEYKRRWTIKAFDRQYSAQSDAVRYWKPIQT